MEYDDMEMNRGRLYDIDSCSVVYHSVLRNIKPGTLVGSFLCLNYRKEDFEHIQALREELKQKDNEIHLHNYGYKVAYELYKKEAVDKALEMVKQGIITDANEINIEKIVENKMKTRTEEHCYKNKNLRFEREHIERQIDDLESEKKVVNKDYQLIFSKFLHMSSCGKIVCEVTDFVKFKPGHFHVGKQIELYITQVQYVSLNNTPHSGEQFLKFQRLSYHKYDQPEFIKNSEKLQSSAGKDEMTNLLKKSVEKDWVIACRHTKSEIYFTIYDKYENYLLCTYKKRCNGNDDIVFVRISYDEIYSVPYNKQNDYVKYIMEGLFANSSA